jgi:hypothetical protein
MLVVKFINYKIIFVIVATFDWKIDQINVKIIFLYNIIEKKIYIKQFYGLKDRTDQVCRLYKALYGLKQILRIWYQTLTEFLKKEGFISFNINNSIFYKKNVIIIIYINNLLIIKKNRKKIDNLKVLLDKYFYIINFNFVIYYLKMIITRD